MRRVAELEFPEGRLQDREIVSDRPGRAQRRAQSRERSTFSTAEGAHDHLTEVFARRVAGIIGEARAAGRFSALVLAAEPRFLGRLRRALDPVTRDLVAATVEKSFAALPDRELPRVLGEAAQAAGRARVFR